MNNIVKLRIFLWVGLFLAVGFFVYMKIVPGGHISYVKKGIKDNYFISKLSPVDRVNITGDKTQEILGDPIYFSLFTSRKFDKAKVTLKYKRKQDGNDKTDLSLLPIIEAGVLVDKIVWRYDLKPVENRIIDQMSIVWDTMRQDDLILLQKNKTYDNIEAFIKNPPDVSKIALYNYDLDFEYLIPGYSKSDKYNEINYGLQGSYQFYTYLKDEDLDLVFDFEDINKNRDSDEVDLYLYYNDQLVDSRHLDDDGITDDKGEIKPERILDFKSAGLPEGVYKIELRANNDIITKNIKTKQRKIAFVNKLQIFNQGKKDIDLYTDSKRAQFNVVESDSLQNIGAGIDVVKIDQIYKQFEAILNRASSSNKIHLEKDGVILSGNGVFSFWQDGIINPKIKMVDNNLDIKNDSIEYVLARYKGIKDENGWTVAESEIDLSNGYREKGKYSFLISVPGLKADDEIKDVIEIKEIKFDLQGKSLFEKIKELAKNPSK